MGLFARQDARGDLTIAKAVANRAVNRACSPPPRLLAAVSVAEGDLESARATSDAPLQVVTPPSSRSWPSNCRLLPWTPRRRQMTLGNSPQRPLISGFLACQQFRQPGLIGPVHEKLHLHNEANRTGDKGDQGPLR